VGGTKVNVALEPVLFLNVQKAPESVDGLGIYPDISIVATLLEQLKYDPDVEVLLMLVDETINKYESVPPT
jgi:hypothetical protein